VVGLPDPVARFATGTRLYMQTALRYPPWGTFLTRVGTRIAARGQLIDSHLTRDLTAAVKQRRIKIDDVRVARDIVLGSIFYGIETMLTERTRAHHPEQLLQCILRGLGLGEEEARDIAFMPIPAPKAVEGPIFSRLRPGDVSAAAERRNKAGRDGSGA
jgi:hypothetical protein